MSLTIRPLAAADFAQADSVFRLAFGTFLGLPEPAQFMGDAQLIGHRAETFPDMSLGAFLGDALVGSALAAVWGGHAVFGPLTVAPQHWGHGIARKLSQALLDRIDAAGMRRTVLFTFPDSLKHVGLYRSLGFHPGTMNLLAVAPAQAARIDGVLLFSREWGDNRAALLAECDSLTRDIDADLHLSAEIEVLLDKGLGEVVALRRDGRLQGFALCHVGAGSEGGSAALYVKFAAHRPDGDGKSGFADLMAAVRDHALSVGVPSVMAGMNAARRQAFDCLSAAGFKPVVHGLTMHRGLGEGWDHADAWVIDDWR